jgi:hypothetical protein
MSLGWRRLWDGRLLRAVLFRFLGMGKVELCGAEVYCLV